MGANMCQCECDPCKSGNCEDCSHKGCDCANCTCGQSVQHAEDETPWMEIFRAGNYGEKGNYSEADIQQLADSYDPAKHEAPVVLGHPKPASGAPAYAWVSKLKNVAGTLMAKLHQVEPAFRESFLAGRYKKRSIALYKSADGKYGLRHLGFLGADVPEVKGLADAAFSQEEFQSIDFDEENTMADDNKSIADRVREALREMFGTPTPQPAFSEDRVRDLILAEQKKTEARFTADLAAERTKREAAEAQFAEYKKTQTLAGLSQRAKDSIAILKANKRWLPAYEHMGVPQLFHALSTADIVEIEFGEGDKKQKKDALQLFTDVLDGLGKIVPEGALSISGVPGAPTFREGVDPDSILFDEAVKQRAKEKKIAYNVAFKELKAEDWKPSKPGASTAGAV